MTRYRSAASGGLALTLLTLAGGTLANEPHHAPYAGFETRAVKAVSDPQRADFLAGRGQGLALAAELNGYPGPLHVLELREDLALTPEQIASTETIFARMKQTAIGLGKEHLEREEALDRLFRGGNARPDSVAKAVAEAGRSLASVRDAHLQAHLEMMAILTPGQIARYSQLRGYVAASHPNHPGDPRFAPPPAGAVGPAGVPMLQRDRPKPDYDGGGGHEGHSAPAEQPAADPPGAHRHHGEGHGDHGGHR